MYLPCRRRFPDVIIAGVKKCGTTALLWLLGGHSRVRGKLKKEVHFFDSNLHRGFGWYLSQFPSDVPDDALVLEKTPAYFVTPGAAEGIQKVC